VSHNNYEIADLKTTNFTQITDIVEVFDFEFSNIITAREKDLWLPVKKKGTFKHAAVVFWFTLNLDADNSIDCSPYAMETTCHWGQAIQYVGEDLEVADDTLHVYAQHNEGRIHFDTER